MYVRLRPLGFPSPVRIRMDRKGNPVEVCHLSRYGAGNQHRSGSRRSAKTVVSIREVWRVDDEWWRQPISRLYHEVVLENGKMMMLYRDLTDGSWYTQ